MNKLIFCVDEQTGELIPADQNKYVIYDVDMLSAYKAKTQKELRMEYGMRAAKPGDRFIWFGYRVGGLWMPEFPVADVSRIVFLTTYLSYRGYLTGDNHRALSKKAVKRLLGLSASKFYAFWNLALESHLLDEKDGKIFPDHGTFRKGILRKAEIARKAESGRYVTRLYIDGIRRLIDGPYSQSAKVAGYIFQLIPFVNREFNIVCHNPLETDLNKVNPMTFPELCDLVGYHKQNAHRMRGQLTGMKITVDGVEQQAVSYENYPSGSLKYGIFINPNIYYAGGDSAAVELLGAFRRRDRRLDGEEG